MAMLKRIHAFMCPASEMADTRIDPTHRGLRQPFVLQQAFHKGLRYCGMPIPWVIVPKEVVVEREEAGDVAAPGRLRSAGLPHHLRGVVEHRQRHEVLGSLFLERQNIMS